MAKPFDPVASVNFIFSECVRFREKLASGAKVIPNSPDAMEFFYTIPHPKVSWSFLVCGQAADARLRELALHGAKHAGIAHNISTKLVRDKLADILVRKFLKEKRPIDRRNVDRAISEAAKISAREGKSITHFIPCHLMLARNPSLFSIGPVIFRTQAEFRSRLVTSIASDRNRFNHPSKLISQTLKYYRSFGWVAEVQIHGCDMPTSEDIAIRAVTSALDCLHLLLEPRYTHKMVIGGPNLAQDWRGTLSIPNGDGLNYSIGFNGAGSVSFEDGWSERFADQTYSKALHLCGVALESIVDPALNRPLSTRFLDAALWFGEAVRERSRATKVVKYATALERMVMTDEKDDVTSILSQRVAAICCEDPFHGFQRWLDDA